MIRFVLTTSHLMSAPLVLEDEHDAIRTEQARRVTLRREWVDGIALVSEDDLQAISGGRTVEKEKP